MYCSKVLNVYEQREKLNLLIYIRIMLKIFYPKCICTLNTECQVVSNDLQLTVSLFFICTWNWPIASTFTFIFSLHAISVANSMEKVVLFFVRIVIGLLPIKLVKHFSSSLGVVFRFSSSVYKQSIYVVTFWVGLL